MIYDLAQQSGPVTKASPVAGGRRRVADHTLHAVELVSVLKRVDRGIPDGRGCIVVRVLGEPRWVPGVRLIFRGPMGGTWQRDYEPGRGD